MKILVVSSIILYDMTSSMLILESARVKLEMDWESEGAAPAPPTLYPDHRVKQELVASPERLQPPGDLPAKEAVQTVKQEFSDSEPDGNSDSDSIYASSECSGEFLIDEPPVGEDQRLRPCTVREGQLRPCTVREDQRLRPCTVRLETDPVVELMCKVLRMKDRTFVCDTCGAQYKAEGSLIRHLKKCSKRIGKILETEDIETRGGKLVCVICNFQYARKEDFDRHFKNCLYRMKRRSEGKVYVCGICCKRYTLRYSLMMHLKKCSRRDSSDLEVKKGLPRKMRYSCGPCVKQFATKQLLRVHVRVHHTGERPYECDVCGKTFNQDSNFKRHKVTHQYHAEKITHTCDHCGKQFAYKTDIIQHMQVHTKLRSYSCATCGKMVSSASHLSRHMLSHFPDKAKKTYPCDVCKKTFLERSNLLVHMRVHTGVKPYSCRFCSTKFSYMTSVLRHELIHKQVVGPFPCRVCKKPFNSTRRLVNHARFHIWLPHKPDKRCYVERLDCSVRLARISIANRSDINTNT